MKRPVLPSSSLRRPARLVAEFSLGYLLSETTCVIGCRVQTTCVIGCRVQTTCVISSRVQTTCEISSRVQTTCVISSRVQTTCVIGCRVQSSPLSNNPCDWLPSSVLSISETICVTGCRVQSCLSLRRPAWLAAEFSLAYLISETTRVIGCGVQSRLSHLWDNPRDWLLCSRARDGPAFGLRLMACVQRVHSFSLCPDLGHRSERTATKCDKWHKVGNRPVVRHLPQLGLFRNCPSSLSATTAGSNVRLPASSRNQLGREGGRGGGDYFGGGGGRERGGGG